MKARQISSALSSVYALGMIDQLRYIERASDGFWGSWQSTGVNAKRILHAGDVIARIGLDDRVSAWQRMPRAAWQHWDLEVAELTATRLPGGAPVLFAADREQQAWYTWKPSPQEAWKVWEPLEGPVARLAAAVIPGGGLVVFGIRDGTVVHRWQERPGASWEPWTTLDRPPGGTAALDVLTITGGGLALFALSEDGALWHRWQDKPYAPWHDWEQAPLGRDIAAMTLTKSPGGGLGVFAVGTDHAVRYRVQLTPFGDWGGWTELGGTARSLTAQASFTDGLEVFIIGLDHEVYHTWCDRIDARWAEWTLLDHEESPYRAAGQTQLPSPSQT